MPATKVKVLSYVDLWIHSHLDNNYTEFTPSVVAYDLHEGHPGISRIKDLSMEHAVM